MPLRRFAACSVAFLVTVIAGSRLGRADLDAKAVTRGKRATVLIETEGGRGSATAFCIDASARLFVTDAHAVGKGPERGAARPGPGPRQGRGQARESGAGRGADRAGDHAGELKLVLNPGEQDQKVTSATVLKADDKADLALLQLAGDPGVPLTALELGDPAGLTETQQLVAFGYPFGRILADKDDFPSITVTTGRVTALRKRKGELLLIQLDNSLNPGNSGGPVLDPDGKVVGVVLAGILGTGVNFATPISALHSMLAEPQIRFSPGPVRRADATKPRPFVVSVITLDHLPGGGGDKAGPLSVALVLNPGTPAERKLEAKPQRPSTRPAGPDSPAAERTYEVTAPLVPPREGPGKVRVTARYTGGAVTCLVDDVPVKVGDKSVQLGKIRRIETVPHEPPKVVLDGQVLRGPVGGADHLRGDMGEVSLTLDLGKVSSADLQPVEDVTSEVSYRVVVKRGDKEVGQLSGAIPIEGAPLAAAPADLAAPPAGGTDTPAGTSDATAPTQQVTPPPQEDRTGAPPFPPPDLRPEGERVVDLPGPAVNVVAGGGGRFLIFHCKTLSKLAVLDLSEARVVKTLPLPAGDIAYAAGLTKLMVGSREANSIQRWDLNTLEREITSQGPEGGIRALAMGYDSNAPLLVSGEKHTLLVDPKTMRGEQVLFNPPWQDFPDAVRMSANGRLAVGFRFPGWAGARTMLLAGYAPTATYQGGYVNWSYMLPAADGNLVFDTVDNERGKIWPPDMSKEMFVEGTPGMVFPAYDPAYFVSYGTRDNKPKVVVYNAGDFKPVCTKTGLDDLQAGPQHDPPLQPFQRVHLFPKQKLLATVNPKADKVTLRTLDVLQELEASGLDYLLVTSRSPWAVVKGQTYTYPVHVLSKRGGVKISLDGGPKGMTLSPDGVLHWSAPATFDQPAVSVSLLIKDAGGQEVAHAFQIRVIDPHKSEK